MLQDIEPMMIYIFKDSFPTINFNSLFMFMPVNIEEFYKLKYCSTVVYMVPRA